MRQALSVCFSLAVLAACGLPTANADLYTNDAETRREATESERAWLVQFNQYGIGIALSKNWILTCGHCFEQHLDALRGSSLVGDPKNTFKFVRVVEYSPVILLDYAILEVEWTHGGPPAEQRFPRKLNLDIQRLKRDLFTVGLPQDKKGVATYASGQFKTLQPVIARAEQIDALKKQFEYLFGWMKDLYPTYATLYDQMLPRAFSEPPRTIHLSDLRFNIGLNKGNSGGPVFSADDESLVSIVTGGPHEEYEPKFFDNALEDPAAWNTGVDLIRVYVVGTALEDVFPDGNNRFLDSSGKLLVPSTE